MNNDTLIGKFELFLLTHARYSANTCLAYSRDVNQFSQYLTKNSIFIETLHKENIKNYMHYLYELGLAASSRARKVESLRKFFEFLDNHCGLPFAIDGFNFQKIKIDRKLPETLTTQEIKALLKTVDKATHHHAKRNRAMIYLLYGTGIRIMELLNLKKDDIGFSPPLLRVMGKGKERLIPYPVSCSDIIKEHIKTIKGLYVFSADDINPLSRQNAAQVLNTIAKKAKIKRKLYPHLFRHTYATHLLINGANIRQIQTLMGHEHIASTQIYASLNMKQLRKDYDKRNIRA